MNRRCARAMVVGGAVLAAAGTARAEPDPHTKAVDLFLQARKHIRAGDCTRAIPNLVESVQLEPSVGAELSLADCYEKTDPVQAWRQVEEAARVASDKHDVRLGTVTERAAALAATLPTVEIVVPPASDLPGLEVRVDGVKVDSFLYLRGPIATTPGRHIVDAAAPGKKWSDSVDAQVGRPVTVTVVLEGERPAAEPPPVAPPRPPPPAPPAANDADGGSGRRAAGFALGGVGVAGLALGAVAGFLALSEEKNISNACGGLLANCSAQHTSPTMGTENDALSNAKTWATLSTIGFIAGGALVAFGGILVLSAPKGPSGPSASLVLTPLVGRGDVFAGLVGAW